MASAALLALSSMMQAQAPSGGATAASDGFADTPAQEPSGKDVHISPQQAKELFRSVDQITKFASQDSGLAGKHEVKRRLTTRNEVESYITDRLREDKDTQRMERSEIVLKKFGLLDRDFRLQPFLVSLLREQVAGYYDAKTKTVNLLDWIEPDQQKPVLAHELTHALQDQHVDLDKWGDQSIEGLSYDVDNDNKHLAVDEADTARDAITEGQAMVVFIDWGLKAKGATLRTIPKVMEDDANNADASASDSPVLARAPLLLQQSLLFPYREGLNFEQTLLQDKGTQAAFAGVLDRPPSSSYEIMNPLAYEQHGTVPLLHVPDIHPLLDTSYDPYDIGSMGELDVRMIAELFAGRPAGAAMAKQWNGGLYYAAQAKSAKTPEQRASTASVAIFYLSQWRTEAAATRFAALYADSLRRKYSRCDLNTQESGQQAQIYNTEEGPVLIARTGKQVFVSESFDLDTARKLQLLLQGAQGSDDDVQTRLDGGAVAPPVPHELTAPMSEWLGHAGLMRAGMRSLSAAAAAR